MSSRLHPFFNQRNFTNSMPHQRTPLGNDRGLQQAVSNPMQSITSPSTASTAVVSDEPKTSGPWPSWYENSPAHQGTYPGGPNSRMAPIAAAAASSGGGGGAAAGAARAGGAGSKMPGGSAKNLFETTTLAGKALGAGLDYATAIRDNNFQAHIQNNYFGTVHGGQGIWNGMGTHASMEAMARQRAQDKANMGTKIASGLGGPIGGFIGLGITSALRDRWEKDELGKLDYRNAWNTEGQRMDSRHAPTSTYKDNTYYQRAAVNQKFGPTSSISPNQAHDTDSIGSARDLISDSRVSTATSMNTMNDPDQMSISTRASEVHQGGFDLDHSLDDVASVQSADPSSTSTTVGNQNTPL